MTAAVAGSDPRPDRPYLAPVPDTEPPFDPDLDAPTGRPRRSGSRPTSRTASSGLGRTGAPTALLTVPTSVACEAVPSWSADADVGVRRTATAQLPPARRAAHVLATALVEVLSGRRPIGQLRVHTSPGVFAGLAVRTPRGWGAPTQVNSVRVCQPADGVAEICATVRGTRRVLAMAFRIEGVDGRWRITALDLG
ncbi:MAG TPA: Rv3235 family protein [Nakamurella sp.]